MYYYGDVFRLPSGKQFAWLVTLFPTNFSDRLRIRRRPMPDGAVDCGPDSASLERRAGATCQSREGGVYENLPRLTAARSPRIVQTTRFIRRYKAFTRFVVYYPNVSTDPANFDNRKPNCESIARSHVRLFNRSMSNVLFCLDFFFDWWKWFCFRKRSKKNSKEKLNSILSTLYLQ